MREGEEERDTRAFVSLFFFLPPPFPLCLLFTGFCSDYATGISGEDRPRRFPWLSLPLLHPERGLMYNGDISLFFPFPARLLFAEMIGKELMGFVRGRSCLLLFFFPFVCHRPFFLAVLLARKKREEGLRLYLTLHFLFPFIFLFRPWPFKGGIVGEVGIWRSCPVPPSSFFPFFSTRSSLVCAEQ